MYVKRKMYHQHTNSSPTMYPLHDAPQVLKHLEDDDSFPEVFFTALRAIVDNEAECRKRFNSMAYNYLVGTMTEDDKQSVDNVFVNLIGFPLSTIINTAEHNINQRTSAATVDLEPLQVLRDALDKDDE